MPTGLYTRHARLEFDADLQRFKPRQNTSRIFECMIMSYFRRMRPNCINESIYTTWTQKKIDCFNANGFCGHCNTVFEGMGRFFHYCPCQEAWPALTQEDIQRGTKKKKMDELRRQNIEERVYTVFEKWEREGWELYNPQVSVKEYLRQSIIYKRPLRQDQSPDKISRTVWIRTVWYQSSRKSERTLRKFPANFRNYRRM